jgi:hypothetical protein
MRSYGFTYNCDLTKFIKARREYSLHLYTARVSPEGSPVANNIRIFRRFARVEFNEIILTKF